MDDSKSRPEGKPVPKKPAGGGVGTPFAGESSTSGVPLPSKAEVAPSDPFLTGSDPLKKIPDNAQSSGDAATVIDTAPSVDSDVTIVDATSPIPKGSSPRRTPPPSSSWNSGASASAAVFQVGEVLGGRYEILQLLGEGGMGAVYKAADRELDRVVGLKVIRPELASNP